MEPKLMIEKRRAVELIEKFSKFVVERKLAAAAIMTIESLRPLNYLGSQALYTISPFVEVFFQPGEVDEIAAMLENREYIDLTIRRIDELDEEMYRQERDKRRLSNKRRKEKFRESFRKFTNKFKKIKK